jgi:hypothetical protein
MIGRATAAKPAGRRRHGAGVEKLVASRILGTKIPQTRNGYLEAVQAPSLAAK